MKFKLLKLQGQEPSFRPYLFQQEFLSHMQAHTREQPARALLVWPRRHGKDLTALHNLAAMAHDRVGMYWHGLPTYEQARLSCWNAFRTDTGRRLMDDCFPREVVRRPTEYAPAGEMLVELKNGGIIRFVGSDTVDRIVGSGIVGLNASEYALWKPSALDYISPMLRESRGWAAFLSTPRGHNHLWKLLQKVKDNPNWLVSHKTILNAGRYTQAEAMRILEEEREEGMLPERIQQEYFCDFSAALVGSYYGDLLSVLEARGALSLDFDHRDRRCFVSWDLGIADSTALWVWSVDSQGRVDFLNHYESSSKPLEHYFEVLDGWASTFGYKYEALYLPHDARARTLQTGMSVLEQVVKRYTSGKVRIVPNLSILDGIAAARSVLQKNIRFHKNCDAHDGLEALRQYSRKYDEAKRAYALHPEHNWCSHSADAFRYACIVMKLSGAIRPPRPKSSLLLPAGTVGITLDQAWKCIVKPARVRA